MKRHPYQRPTLERFGTLRELTLAGGVNFGDGWTTDSTDGCALKGSSGYVCTQPKVKH